MPTHYYVLDKPNATDPTFIYFMYQCADGRLKYSLGIKLIPAEWATPNKKKQSDEYRNAIIQTERINSMMAGLSVKQSVDGEPITRQSLKMQLDVLLGKVKVAKKEHGFFDMFQKIIDERATGKDLHKGKKYSKGTVKGYRRTKELLLEWQTATGFLLDMQTFDIHSYHGLYDYLTNKMQLALNSVGSQLKTLKAFLKAAHGRGWHTSRFYMDEKFQIPSEDTVDIYLTIPELETMAGLELTGTVKIARDWLIVEAFTGLRVSDALRLTQINIGATKIHISNEKTDETVVLPMHKMLKDVLERNGNNWPPFLAAQTINEKLKIAGKEAGLDSLVLYSVTRGGVRVDEYLPRYKLLTNHTGRRSFITNLLRNNANESMVMKLTGIRKPGTLQRYNKMNAHEVADMASEMDFFK